MSVVGFWTGWAKRSYWLRSNGYKTYIVTGGGQDFVRVYAEGTYGIPPEQVVGSAGATKFGYAKDGTPVLTQLKMTGLSTRPDCGDGFRAMGDLADGSALGSPQPHKLICGKYQPAKSLTAGTRVILSIRAKAGSCPSGMGVVGSINNCDGNGCTNRVRLCVTQGAL